MTDQRPPTDHQPTYGLERNRPAAVTASSADKKAWRVVEEELGLDLIEEALAYDVVARGRAAKESDPEASETDLESAVQLSPAAAMLRTLRDPSFYHQPDCRPGCTRHSIRTAARMHGVLLPELLEMIRSRDIAVGLAMSGRHASAVMDGIARLAQFSRTVCTVCWGEKEVPMKDEHGAEMLGDDETILMKTCPCCKGEGTVEVPPQVDFVKLFLKLHGLERGGGGAGGAGTTVNVGVNAQAGVKVGGSTATGTGSPSSQQEHVTVRLERIMSGGPAGSSSGPLSDDNK